MTSESHGVCNGIKLTRTKDGTCKVFMDYGGILIEVISATGETIKHYTPGHKVNALIREALGKEPLPPTQPIVIEVRGGVVQDVLNVPEGLEYIVKDYDEMEGGA